MSNIIEKNKRSKDATYGSQPIEELTIGSRIVFRRWDDILQLTTNKHPNTGVFVRLNNVLTNVGNTVGYEYDGYVPERLTDCQQMFYDTTNVVEINHIPDTSLVTNMYRMFAIDTNSTKTLTSISALSDLNTGECINMNSMFSMQELLTELDLSSFNTQKCNNMGYMFRYCKSLSTIDLSSFDFSNVLNMSYMFCLCENLTSVIFPEGEWNINPVKYSSNNRVDAIFRECSSIEYIDMSMFNIFNIHNVSFMFYECTALKTLKLGIIDTDKSVTSMYMNNIFGGCSNLTSLSVAKLNLVNLTSTAVESIFYGLTKLANVTGQIICKTNINLTSCPLTRSSALVFINGLGEVTSTTYIRFKSTTYSTLTEEDIAIATSKGWTVTSA